MAVVDEARSLQDLLLDHGTNVPNLSTAPPLNPVTGRSSLDYAMGFISYTPGHLDLPTGRDHWSKAVRNPNRRAVLLLYPDVHWHVHTHPAEQTSLAADIFTTG